MKNEVLRQIVFTKPNTAELLTVGELDVSALTAHQVAVKTYYSTVSCGTERANISGNANVSGSKKSGGFPRELGYSSAGVVVAVGTEVTKVKPGDRVVVYWCKHINYNVVKDSQVEKLPDSVDFKEAAVSFIATFPLAAIRKMHLEIGESCLVMGLGILGQLAVKLAKIGGAYPVIAADPNESRRALALSCGADYALNPLEENFAEQVKEITEGGVKTAVEVTGVGAGLNEVLGCMAKFGRVALLGCTRESDFTIDYYKKVHFPGITLIGAHTMARPDAESYPGYWTHNDDIRAVLNLCRGNRLSLKDLISEWHSPADCPAVYTKLVFDKNCPVGMQFDWENFEEKTV